MNRFEGGCACGSVHYEVEAEPMLTTRCHCRDCQRMTGSAFSTNLVVDADAVVFRGDAAASFEKAADRGHAMIRGFCRRCGSPLFVKNSAFPKVLMLAGGSLDDPSWVRPEMEIYSASAQPWDRLDPNLPHHPGMPPLP